MNIAAKRINNQLQEIQNNPPTNWKVSSQNWNEWDVWVTANNSCPFHSIPFLLKVVFPQNYPQSQPIFRLPHPEKFFHPNIYIDGEICEKTLTHYDPTMTIRKRIDAFVTLLGIPNPYSPACSNAAALYKENPRQYNKKALKVFRGLEKK